MYKRIQKEEFAFESFEELNSPSVISGISTNSGNGCNLALHTGADRDLAIKNRTSLFLSIGIDPASIVTVNQIHSDIIIAVGEKNKGSGATDPTEAQNGDALITNVKNLPLVIFTADCAPIIIFDRKNNAIGLVHAGWKGTQSEIFKKSLVKMATEFGTRPKEVLIGLGPMIRRCCYQVSDDFKEKFEGKHLSVQQGRHVFDLAGANMEQAISQGVPQEQIFDSGACTACDEGYHSYRKDKTTSRMGTFIMLR